MGLSGIQWLEIDIMVVRCLIILISALHSYMTRVSGVVNMLNWNVRRYAMGFYGWIHLSTTTSYNPVSFIIRRRGKSSHKFSYIMGSQNLKIIAIIKDYASDPHQEHIE